MNRMKEVSRNEFGAWVRAHPEIEGTPVIADTISPTELVSGMSAMQYIENGVVLAQAIYRRGGFKTYLIRRS